ncbi:MAG: hypothetical protein E6Q71_06110 [Pseudomonas sp.]|nr:MAG: hypothetical protein E6Q71_06110 [Pseudomonas sp.]
MPSLHPKKCLHCKKSFRPKTKASLYCGKSCSNAARASKKLSSRVDGFASTTFGKWLFGAIKQSGTVAVLTDVNIVELYQLWNKCRDYNGYGHGLPRSELYQLSHIAPVAGVGVIGLLDPKNLVIAPASYNQSRYTKWDGVSGRWLNRFEIDPSLSVARGDTATDILKKIRKLLGKSFDDFLLTHKLKLTQAASLAKKLKKAGCNADEAMGLEELRKLEAEYFTTNDDSCGWLLSTRFKADERSVFSEECFRLGACEPVGGGVDWDYLHSVTDCWIVLTKWFDAEEEIITNYFTNETSVFIWDAGYYPIRVRSSDFDPDDFADCNLHIGRIDWLNIVPFDNANDTKYQRF